MTSTKMPPFHRRYRNTICLKFIKGAGETIKIAGEMAEALRDWLGNNSPKDGAHAAGGHSGNSACRFNGLRPFGKETAEGYLDLLPGLRGRGGLPRSIVFWKHRIEETSITAMRLGVLHGPSGTGKTSFINAGLIPHLGPTVTSVKITATPKQSEAALRRELARQYPQVSELPTLTEAFIYLRDGTALPQGHKVVVIIDQFEQWLHANGRLGDSEMEMSLRQCDGSRLTCILSVRSDFWNSLISFMQRLERRT